MAGHSKFKNIMHRKGAQDKKRAKIFTKILREITVSVSNGIVDPQFNPRLRLALIDARASNLPKDKIENAIKKATASQELNNYSEVRYEGYGNSGVAFIVETLTDNRNRTASDVRSTFSKFGGVLGETGSVNFMFRRVGSISYEIASINANDILELSIDAGALDCSSEDEIHEVECEPEDLHGIREKLEKAFGEPKSAKLVWKPITINSPDHDVIRTILKLIDALEDLDDVQHVWTNLDIPDDFDDENLRD